VTAQIDTNRQGQAYAHPAHLLPQRRADAILHHAQQTLRAAEAVREAAYEAVHQAVRSLGLEDDRAPVHRAQAVAHATEEAVNVARTAYYIMLWAVGDGGPHYAVEGPIEGAAKGGADADTHVLRADAASASAAASSAPTK